MALVDLTLPNAIVLALDDLVTCMCAEVTASGGPLCWCGLWQGETVSWDYCEECSGGACGMGWVRLVTVFPYQEFPVPAVVARCTLPLAYQIELGVVRCMPTADTDGNLPPPAAIAEAANIALLDAQAMHRAMVCCSPPVIPELYTATGPQGGCGGGAWTGYLSLD